MSKITREILGQKIEVELTEAEELSIYDAVQNRYDAEVLNEYLESEGYFGVHDVMLKAMAKEMRDIAYDSDMSDGMDDARAEVLKRHRGMLEYFREAGD